MSLTRDLPIHLSLITTNGFVCFWNRYVCFNPQKERCQHVHCFYRTCIKLRWYLYPTLVLSTYSSTKIIITMGWLQLYSDYRMDYNHIVLLKLLPMVSEPSLLKHVACCSVPASRVTTERNVGVCVCVWGGGGGGGDRHTGRLCANSIWSQQFVCHSNQQDYECDSRSGKLCNDAGWLGALSSRGPGWVIPLSFIHSPIQLLFKKSPPSPRRSSQCGQKCGPPPPPRPPPPFSFDRHGYIACFCR